MIVAFTLSEVFDGRTRRTVTTAEVNSDAELAATAYALIDASADRMAAVWHHKEAGRAYPGYKRAPWAFDRRGQQ